MSRVSSSTFPSLCRSFLGATTTSRTTRTARIGTASLPAARRSLYHYDYYGSVRRSSAAATCRTCSLQRRAVPENSAAATAVRFCQVRTKSSSAGCGRLFSSSQQQPKQQQQQQKQQPASQDQASKASASAFAAPQETVSVPPPHAASAASSSSSSSSSATTTVGKLATFAAIGTVCLVAANYLTRPDSADQNQQLARPQAKITSRAYLDMTVDDQPIGRIVIGLYGDVVPKTVANFQALCRGDTMYDNNRLRLRYQNTVVHRIIPGFMLHSGDFICNNGTGGRSIYGGRFADENFTLRHTGPGVVSMANAGPNTNGSQFFICVAPTAHLDGRHVVFGTVLDGWDVVQRVEACGTRSGRPTATVRIASCGVLPPPVEDDKNELQEKRKQE